MNAHGEDAHGQPESHGEPGHQPPPWGTPPPTPPAHLPEPPAHLPEPLAHLPEPPALPRQRAGGSKRSGWGKAGAAGAGIAALAGKAGLLAKVWLLFKGLLVLAKFKAFASMIISVGVYALFWGWKFALGFVVLLAVHELGHVVALRAQGVEASAPMFIPLMGAFVRIKGEQRSVAEEAWSALAGPAMGVAGALACLQLAELGDSLLLRALAYTGFFLNLFNLAPVLPLDGGRVGGALHPAVWLGGIGVAVALLVWRPNPVLGFVLLLGVIEAVRRWRDHRKGLTGDYHRIPAATRGWIAAAYVSVALVCLWGMHISYVPRPY